MHAHDNLHAYVYVTDVTSQPIPPTRRR